jgi:RNA polymerase sigma-70 factor (sigma-E family)
VAAPDDFVEWATAHRTRLLRSAYLISGDLATAEDLVQEAVIKVAQRWEQLRAGHPTAYARTIIARDHISWWRRTREVPVEDVRSDTRSTDVDVATRHVLMGALAELPRGQRAVVVLRYFDDLTERETAEILGISIGTVKSQAHDALHRLRERQELGDLSREEPLR